MADYYTSQDQFEKLHEAVDKVRDSTPYVYVDKQALKNLLSDHREYAILASKRMTL